MRSVAGSVSRRSAAALGVAMAQQTVAVRREAAAGRQAASHRLPWALPSPVAAEAEEAAETVVAEEAAVAVALRVGWQTAVAEYPARRSSRHHSGTLPCLRLGSSSRLDASMRRPATNFWRVSAGSITSSMYPRSAAA